MSKKIPPQNNRLYLLKAIVLALSIILLLSSCKKNEEISKKSQTYDFKSTDVSFSNESENLVGTLTIPVNKKKYSIVVMLHGFGSNKEELPVTQTNEGIFNRTAQNLAKHGIATLRFDFRGSGKSGGNWEDTRFSGQISDTLAALGYLADIPKIKSDKIGVLGFSQGGLVASSIAKDSRIASIVLWNPVANPYITYSTLFTPDAVAKGFKLADGEVIDITLPWEAKIKLKQGFFEDIFAIDPIGEISKYSNPLLLVISRNDTLVWPEPQMGKLYLKAHNGKQKMVILDTGHVFNVFQESDTLDNAINETVSWFKETL